MTLFVHLIFLLLLLIGDVWNTEFDTLQFVRVGAVCYCKYKQRAEQLFSLSLNLWSKCCMLFTVKWSHHKMLRKTKLSMASCSHFSSRNKGFLVQQPLHNKLEFQRCLLTLRPVGKSLGVSKYYIFVLKSNSTCSWTLKTVFTWCLISRTNHSRHLTSLDCLEWFTLMFHVLLKLFICP